MPRRNRSERRDRLVRQQRQDNSGQDQELAGGDDFLDFDAPRQIVQLLAPGE
ncbi:MAG TPA: hypothetical protein VHU22_14320 [Xanthobacteraceae bacterium]|nr:hypothetical protein [Xanthobacteraceae bacterium]